MRILALDASTDMCAVALGGYEGFAERSKIAARLELPQDWGRLPQDYELCLFRIAQECLTNIHRHSGSMTALVRLLRSPEEITLEVSDEGQGVSQEIQSKITSGETAGVGAVWGAVAVAWP